MVGKSGITLNDTGSIILESDEQVTFLDEHGSEYDVCKKIWGYYATPSVNGRLKNFGFRTVIVENEETKMVYVMIVYENMMTSFEEYLSSEGLFIREWLS